MLNLFVESPLLASALPSTKGNNNQALVTFTEPITYCAVIDRFLLRLYQCTQTRRGTDTILIFASNTARIIIAFLEFIPTVTKCRLMQKSLNRHRLRLKALLLMLGEWRTMNRLWGFLSTYLEAKDLFMRERESGGSTSLTAGVMTVIGALQVAVLMLNQVGEAIAWLATKYALDLSPKSQDRAENISSCSWIVFLVMEVAQLSLKRWTWSSSSETRTDFERKRRWLTDFTQALAWMVSALYRTRAQELLPNIVIAAIAAYPSTNAMTNLWYSTP